MVNILLLILGLAFVILCLFTVVIVLLQPGRSSGGGLAGGGGGMGGAGAIAETLGATQAEKSLARWTAWGLTIFFVLCIVLTLLGSYREDQGRLNLGGAQAAPGVAPGVQAPTGEAVPITGQGGTITIPPQGTQQGGTIEIPAGDGTVTIPAEGTAGEAPAE